MLTPLREFEFESEWEGEEEFEGEWESEYEGEEFFQRLRGLARRAVQSPALRRLALRAARRALGSLGNVGAAIGGQQGRQVGGRAADILGSSLPQSEFEGEFEGEFESEFEGEFESEFEWEGEAEAYANPSQGLQAEALMAHLGHAAAEAESEDEAEAFLGALIPLIAQLVPQAAPTVARAAPDLVRGIANVGRTLLNNPATRPLIQALPTVARNTGATIARQVAAGGAVTPATAVRALAQQTANVLGSPQQAVRALQRTRALDQRYHRAAGAGSGGRIPGRIRGRSGPARTHGCNCPR